MCRQQFPVSWMMIWQRWCLPPWEKGDSTWLYSTVSSILYTCNDIHQCCILWRYNLDYYKVWIWSQTYWKQTHDSKQKNLLYSTCLGSVMMQISPLLSPLIPPPINIISFKTKDTSNFRVCVNAWIRKFYLVGSNINSWVSQQIYASISIFKDFTYIMRHRKSCKIYQ